jgi:spore coat polysaccharide biosynthesis predicted glycosyltransferase SpsG
MSIKLSKKGLNPTKLALFRVDAGPGIGMGHFMRCRTLAFEMIKLNWIIVFVGSGLPLEDTSSNPVHGDINYIPCIAKSNSSEDMDSFIGLIEKLFDRTLNLIVVDSYRYLRDDFVRLYELSNYTPIAVIDDLANRDTPAHAVINPNPLFDEVPYQRQKIEHILCGEKYTFIRPEIRHLIGRRYDPAGYIIITLGGGDVSAPLMKILNALPTNLERRICVSVGKNCPLNNINEWIRKDPGNRFLNTDSDKFPELLAASSLAITAGGTTLWEVYALGIPSISVVWVDNQQHTTNIIKDQATSFLIDIVSNINLDLESEWLEQGMNKLVDVVGPPGCSKLKESANYHSAEVIQKQKTSMYVDNPDEVDREFLQKAIFLLTSDREFVKEMIEKQQKLIDGNGAIRVAKLLNEIQWGRVKLYF